MFDEDNLKKFQLGRCTVRVNSKKDGNVMYEVGNQKKYGMFAKLYMKQNVPFVQVKEGSIVVEIELKHVKSQVVCIEYKEKKHYISFVSPYNDLFE